MIHSLIFPFLVLNFVNLLFHTVYRFTGSGPQVVTFL